MKHANILDETRRLGPVIRGRDAGRRLDEYLAEFFPFFSRAGWQKEIKSGMVLVNSTPARKPSQKLWEGDELCRISPVTEEPEVDTTLEVIWQDKEIAAVIKPAGLPMHEGGRYHKNTFVNMLPKYLGPGWTHVHRLDRETSGVVLCAKTAEMRAKLTEHWSQRQVEKTYLAITTSKPELNHWHINQPILKERHLRTNRAELSPDGDEAFTEFTVLSSGVEESLIAAKPLTGRTNQIRLHLNASNLCLVGEKLYGVNPEILEIYRKEGNTMRVQEMAGFSRHALHCWKLKFRHPGNNQVHECVAPLADDLVDLCKKRGVPYINL